MYSLYSSLIINISLLVLIATILTKLTFVKQILSEEHSRLTDQLCLALIFGLFCVFSTCTGVKVNGAIQNTRVLGALAAGLLGGPVVGIGAAMIGALHRFLYDPHGFTSLSCAISTLFEGVFASFLWFLFQKRKLKLNPFLLFFITVFAETCQMGFILCLTKPLADALALVKVIAIPMIVFNSLGMILFFSIFDEVFTKQDLLAANKIRLALTIADRCIPFIQKSSKTKEDYNKMAAIIQEYSNCSGILFLGNDGQTALNNTPYQLPKGLFEELVRKKNTGYSRFKDKNDPNYHPFKSYIAFGAPLTQEENIWAFLILFFPRQILSIQVEMDFVSGLAKFFSTNYELAQVEKQKKLRQRAEFQALQSQINPHFLFNSLNTISCFCREKPERARELLLALSIYFRHTLEAGNAYMIPLKQELEHVQAYLELEKARFEDRLTVQFQIPEYCDISVPALIIQPIVENAVKHGAMKQDYGKVTIVAAKTSSQFILTVSDNGPGFSQQALDNFHLHKTSGKYGLRNVDSRLQSIYGENNGLRIQSDYNGTSVSMDFIV